MSQEDQVTKYIGQKKVKQVGKTENVEIIKVTYEDGSVEHFSHLMLSKIVTLEPIDLSALRDKRVEPMVEVVLQILRDWGIKLSELPYFAAKLNQSLDYNYKQALTMLWGDWMPKPQDPEDVDLITVDRVLRSKDAK